MHHRCQVCRFHAKRRPSGPQRGEACGVTGYRESSVSTVPPSAQLFPRDHPPTRPVYQFATLRPCTAPAMRWRRWAVLRGGGGIGRFPQPLATVILVITSPTGIFSTPLPCRHSFDRHIGTDRSGAGGGGRGAVGSGRRRIDVCRNRVNIHTGVGGGSGIRRGTSASILEYFELEN